MLRPRNALLACALGLAFTAPLLFEQSAVVAQPDDEEKALKKARKDLKKNYKNLLKATESLAAKKEQLRITSYKEPEKRAKLAEEIDQTRSVCFQQVEKVRQADNEKAVEALFDYAIAVPDQDIYERLRDELYKMESSKAIEAMVEILAAGAEPPRRRRGSEDDWKKQIMAAETLAGMEGEDVDQAFADVISKGTNPPVVNAVVRSAHERSAGVVVGPLIDFLGRVEAQGGWEYFQVRQTLTQITGEDFFTKEKWTAWWTKVETGWDPSQKGETKEAATRERGPEEAIPTFFGSEIESNRMVFVIDSSGSMRMTDKPKDSEMTDDQFRGADPDQEPAKSAARMDRAIAETVSAIKNLQPTQFFNIIDFDSITRQWRPGLVPATPENKASAIEWTEGSIVDSGGTYTDLALRLAFSFPDVDTIYLLSDGAPFRKIGNPAPREEWPKKDDGRVDDNQPVAGQQQVEFAQELIDEILDYVRLENRFRKVKIFTFGMDGAGVWHKKWTQPRPMTLPTDSRWLSVLSSFMRELAAISGGQFKSI